MTFSSPRPESSDTSAKSTAPKICPMEKCGQSSQVQSRPFTNHSIPANRPPPARKTSSPDEHPDTTAASREIAALPKFTLTDLAGKPLTADQLKDRVVLVEFWATWCPPCRSTLEWLGDLKRKHGDKLAVVALAVESPEDQIRSTVASLSPDLRWAIADAKTAQGFGDITSVPTLFLFDRAGKTARIVYGAPPDLHQQAEKILESLVK